MSKDIRDYYLPDTIKQQDHLTTLNAIQNNSKHVKMYNNGCASYYQPETIDHFIDSLFTKLIDRCIEMGYYDCCNSTIPIVNPCLRESFEQLIRAHSK